MTIRSLRPRMSSIAERTALIAIPRLLKTAETSLAFAEHAEEQMLRAQVAMSAFRLILCAKCHLGEVTETLDCIRAALASSWDICHRKLARSAGCW